MISFRIPGKPIAKKRPRFARRGKLVTTYNDQETEESKFLFELRHQIDCSELLTGAVHVACIFGMPRPKNHYGTGRNDGILKKSAPKHHIIKRDDIDNLLKFTLDCLNQEVFKDDSQVVSIRASKKYVEGIGYTDVQIYVIGS